jgi:hypothetical protein
MIPRFSAHFAGRLRSSGLRAMLCTGLLLQAAVLFAQTAAQTNTQTAAQTPEQQLVQASLPSSGPYHRVRVQASAGQLLALGVAADHGLRKADLWFEGDFSDRELALIRAAGLRHDVLQQDMAGFYAARIAGDAGFEAGRPIGAATRLDGASCARIPSDFDVPDAFVPGSMGGYYTLQEVYNQMDSMAARYPALVSARTPFGSQLTHQGRPQYLLKMSDNVATDETDEPNVLYTSLMHAREPAGMMSVLFYMQWLLEQYGTDDRATYVLNNAQLYFVPVVNPDGYEINRISNPGGGGLWRKNARNNGSSIGVDLNRNWPYEWGFDDTGSSPSAASDVYRGPSAGSEPEVANLMELAIDRNFRTALNYHSFGELLIYPWGYDFLFTPDHGTFRRGAKSMVADNFYSYGTPVQTVLYPVNGGSDDWFYGEQSLKDKTFSWTPEVGELGFWPPPSAIIPMAQENALANLLLAFFATRYAAVTALHPPLAERSGHFEYRIESYGALPVDAEVSLESLSPELELLHPVQTYPAMEAGQVHQGKVAYRVNDAAEPGARLRYALVLRWPGFEDRQTVEVRFGLEQEPVVPAAADPGQIAAGYAAHSSAANASRGSDQARIPALQPWREQRGGDVLWSDSPGEPYADGLDYTGAIGRFDLSGRKHSQLLMDLRWALEPNRDYAWFEASRDGETWTVLQGTGSRCGASEQGPAFAHYTDASDWVAESLDLSAFDGDVLYVRLRLQSDAAIHAEGIDLRNPRLASVRQSPYSPQEGANPNVDWALRVFPNPATDAVTLVLSKTGLSASPSGPITVQVLDATGRLVQTQQLAQAGEGQTWLLAVSDLAPGLYRVLLWQDQGVMAHTLLAIAQH